MADFKIDFLDHVAIRVKDMEVSAEWYGKVLGLKTVKAPEWDPFPVFLLAGQTGIALFPANEAHPALDPDSLNVKIDHYAFRVGAEAFDAAIRHYDLLGLEYVVKDHIYFRSVYTTDPDGHTVELTALQVEEAVFFNDNHS